MRALIIIASLFITGCGYKPQATVERNDSVISRSVYPKENSANAPLVVLDSTATHDGVFDCILSLHLKDTTVVVYAVHNQDNSIEMAKKYSAISRNQKHPYDCYEVADLPTGLTWNILYNKEDTTFYITDKYDVQALGDTIDRRSINFQTHDAVVTSPVSRRRYKIDLKKIWP